MFSDVAPAQQPPVCSVQEEKHEELVAIQLTMVETAQNEAVGVQFNFIFNIMKKIMKIYNCTTCTVHVTIDKLN